MRAFSLRSWSAMGILLAATTFADGQLQVTSFSPSNNLLAVPTTAPIRMDFDRPLDPTTVTLDNVSAFGRWSGSAPGALQLTNNNQSIIYQPNDSFSAGELVTVTLSENLRAADGATMRTQGFSSQYWTASQRVTGLNYTELDTMTAGNPSRPYGGIATDLDNDGWLDITLVNEDTADLRVYMNLADGTGSFAPFAQPTYAVGNRASPSESADFNMDGNADITVANIDDGTVSVLLGNGDGSFAPQQLINVGSQPRGIAVLDVDGDGDSDIVNTNRGSGNLSLHINDGNGVFGNVPTTLNSSFNGEWSLMAGDMDNNGIMDLVVGSGTSSQIQVLSGNGDGTFTPQAVQNTGGRSWQLALADVDGDGNLDVASANAQNNNGAILLGNGDGTLQPATTYNVANMGSGGNGFPLAIDLGDLDGDGDMDLMTSSFSGDYIVLMNDGTGQFTFYAELDAPTAASCGLMHDFDNDGDLDLGLIDEIANVLVLSRNDGNHVLDGDFDADGDLDTVDVDALVAEIAASSSRLIFDITGDGLLTPADLEEWLALAGAENLASGNAYLLGDANLDGTVDGSDFLDWNQNKFTASAAWTSGDFNADGFVDAQDFVEWNINKFTSADVLAVPEPSSILMLVSLGCICWIRRI